MTEAYRKTLFDELSKIISKLEDEIKEKQTILYYLKSEQSKQAEWFISKMVPNYEHRASSIQALKNLIESMNSESFEKLDDDRFVLFVIPYINEAYKILKHDIEG